MTNPNIPPPPRRLRSGINGWNAVNQRHFIEALANGYPVRDACRHVGLSHASVYKLRRKPEAAAFRAAWDAAANAASVDLAEWGPGGRRYGPVSYDARGFQRSGPLPFSMYRERADE